MDLITQHFPFWRAILSCFPEPILNYFLLVLAIFGLVIFAKLIISVLG